MTIRVLDLESCLYICRRLRLSDREDLAALSGETDPTEFALSRWHRRGIAWVADTNDGEPAFMGGFSRVYDTHHVVCVWLLGTLRYREVMREVIGFIKRHIWPTLAQSDIHRVVAFVNAKDKVAQHFAERMGLIEEVRLPLWGRNGEHFIQYAWLNTQALNAIEEAA